MRYFTYELIAAANDWVEQSDEMRVNAEARFSRVVKRYHDSLQLLRPRMSRQAWHFFANGHGRWGLHDACRWHTLAHGGLDGLGLARCDFYGQEVAIVWALSQEPTPDASARSTFPLCLP